MLAIALVNQLQALLAWYLQTSTAEGLVWDFRAQLLRHVQRLPMSFHDRAGAVLDDARVVGVEQESPAWVRLLHHLAKPVLFRDGDVVPAAAQGAVGDAHRAAADRQPEA